MLRERGVKKNVQALLKDLREKNLMNEELKDRLECYSGNTNLNILYIGSLNKDLNTPKRFLGSFHSGFLSSVCHV